MIHKNGKGTVLDWSPAAAVVAFEVRIKTLNDRSRSQSIPNPFDLLLKPKEFTWRLTYLDKLNVDMTRYVNISHVNATIVLDSGSTDIVDYASTILYHLNELVDDCDIPDSSLHSTTSPVLKDTSGTHASISCNKEFKSGLGYLKCPTNGDWETYENVVNCEPIACKEFEEVGVEYRPELVNNYAVNGTKAYYKCKNYENINHGEIHNYVECNESGEWQGKLEHCSGQTMGYVKTYSSGIIGLIIGMFTLLVLVIYLIAKRKPRFITSKTKYDSTDYDDNDNILKPVNVAPHLKHFYPLSPVRQ